MSQKVANVSGLRSMESTHKTLTILRCKLVIVGDACAGKTALTQVFESGGSTYPKNYLMTVGAEFCVKQIPIPNTNIIVELFIYDCAGQSIFNQLGMNSKYFEGVSTVMVVYDISNIDSLKACPKWLEGVRAVRPSGPQLSGVLVGNKSDFRDGTSDSRAEVPKDEGQRMAADLGLTYFETSAANNTDVDAPFKHIAEEFYRRYEDSAARADDISSNRSF